MSNLTVTAKGQVTLRKDILRHLGVRPGEKITVDRLSDGRIEVKAERPYFRYFQFPEEGEQSVLVDRRN